MLNWLASLFRRSEPSGKTPQARITCGGSSAGRSLSRTGLLLKKQLWIWPIIAGQVYLAVIVTGLVSLIVARTGHNHSMPAAFDGNDAGSAQN